jgi:hypothetical protein
MSTSWGRTSRRASLIAGMPLSGCYGCATPVGEGRSLSPGPDRRRKCFSIPMHPAPLSDIDRHQTREAATTSATRYHTSPCPLTLKMRMQPGRPKWLASKEVVKICGERRAGATGDERHGAGVSFPSSPKTLSSPTPKSPLHVPTAVFLRAWCGPTGVPSPHSGWRRANHRAP